MQRHSRKQSKNPFEKSKLYDHFEHLNNISENQQNSLTTNDNLNVTTTEQEGPLCMKKNKNGKSAGLDDVYPEFIRFVPDELLLMITTFFNKVLDKQIVLDNWATSIYRPVFKKGEKTDPNNYRGISLAS